MTHKAKIRYVRSYDIERSGIYHGRLSYRWFPGWARVVNGRSTLPPITYREAQAEAKKEGATAVFDRA